MSELEVVGKPSAGPIRGAVAALVNERELVINRGAQHGVVRGMKFRVLTQNDVEVIDPETGESLGNISRVKVRVEASAIQDNMTICRTYETIRGGLGAMAAFQRQLNDPVYRTLKTNDSGFLPPISEADSYIQIGDPVEQIE